MLSVEMCVLESNMNYCPACGVDNEKGYDLCDKCESELLPMD